MITINATGDTTLHTAGKYCPEDILIKVPTGNGSSGGSGNVETCTVTLSDDLSCTTWYYTDSNMTLQTHNNSGSIVVPINTLILYIINGSFGDIVPHAMATGNTTHMINYMSLGVVHAYGDGNVYVYNSGGGA